MANVHYGAPPGLAKELQPSSMPLCRKSSDVRSERAAKDADLRPIFLFPFARSHVIVDQKTE